MSKYYNSYLRLKEKDINKLYLFECGIFYIFLDHDAVEVSKYTTLKCNKFMKNVVKCGFPKQSLKRYMAIFENLKLNVEVVDVDYVYEDNNIDIENIKIDGVVRALRKIDLDSLTPIDAMGFLSKLKEDVISIE